MRKHNKAYRSSEIFNYYSLNRNKWFDFYKSERTIIQKLKIKKNSKILDIGSACGGLGEVLKKRYKVKKYTGIEINKKAYDYAKSKNKNFTFIYSDLLNYEKNKKNNSKFNFVFSLGCIDWNFELDKMLNKSWKHVEEKGYLVITLRITNIPKFKKSYQFINFSKKKQGEKASYQVLYIENLLKKLSKLNISKILHYGYWGKPNLTVVTHHKKVFFVALALQKNSKNKNIIKFNKFKKNFFK